MFISALVGVAISKESKWKQWSGFFFFQVTGLSDYAQDIDQIRNNYRNGSAARKHSAVLKDLSPAAATASSGVQDI